MVWLGSYDLLSQSLKYGDEALPMAKCGTPVKFHYTLKPEVTLATAEYHEIKLYKEYFLK